MSHPHDELHPWCIVCGKPATNKHHEPPKALGGIGRKGLEPPRISLCGSGTTGCHGKRHAGEIKFRYVGRAWEYNYRRRGWKPCITEFEEYDTWNS